MTKERFSKSENENGNKKLLKKYGYPPDKREDAVQTVMPQCELWVDNACMGEENAGVICHW